MRKVEVLGLTVVLFLTFGLCLRCQAAEKVLVVAQAGDVATLDNQQLLGPSKNLLIHVYDWQWMRFGVASTPEGVLYSTRELLPGIIERWETRLNADGTVTYVFHVRPGQVFHSGNPITAEDFKYTLMRRAAFRRDYIHTFLGAMYSIDENLDQHIRIINTYTFEVDAKRPMPLFWEIWMQRTYYDSKLMREHATDKDPWSKEFAVRGDAGSGPYVIEEWIPGVEIRLRRFDKYWDNPPYFDYIIWRIIPDVSARVLLLKKGEIDVALDLPVREILGLLGDPNIKIISAPSANQLAIPMNAKIPPFDNINLRWALTYAFPYDEVISTVFLGHAQPNYGPIPTGFPGALAERRFKTDLDLARQYLEKAGYSRGLTLELYYDASYSQHEQIGILFKKNLEKIGVNLELRPLPTGQFQTGLRERTLGMFIQEALGWINTPEYYFNMNFNSQSSANSNGYSNPEVDALISLALTEMDDVKRAELNARIQELVLADATWIYICQPNFLLAMRRDLEGYVYQNTELHHFWLLRRTGD